MCNNCTGSAVRAIESLVTFFQSSLKTNLGDKGGAIALFQCKDNSIIQTCNITDNIALSSGGGIYIY